MDPQHQDHLEMGKCQFPGPLRSSASLGMGPGPPETTPWVLLG